jgi:hypothetical protein
MYHELFIGRVKIRVSRRQPSNFGRMSSEVMRIVFILAAYFLTSCVALSQEAKVTSDMKALLGKIKADETPAWNYDELARKSDLIVVATLVQKQQVDPGIVGKTDLDEGSIQRVSNTLRILSTLKGEPKQEIRVITTQWGANTVALGVRTRFAVLQERMLLPNLIPVEIDGKITDWGLDKSLPETEIVPEYLLYLKHSGRENVFVPVTNQRWAGASVRLLKD